MIIAINGGIGTGKDELAKIIQWHLAVEKSKYKKTITAQGYEHSDYTLLSGFEIKKFADPIKDTVALWLGCTREDLEDRDFKEKELGDEWVKIFNGVIKLKNETDYCYTEAMRLTPRKMMQLLGTECGRDIIHEDIWVNILFRDYLKSRPQAYNNVVYDEGDFPNWLISDMRFPNELRAVKERGGITIKVERNLSRTIQEEFEQHKSEGALSDSEFDYIIDNNGSKEELVQKVKGLLIDLKLIK